MYNNKRGVGYWKMNSSILLKEEYKNNIIQIIRKIEELKFEYVEKWELLKQKVKENQITIP